MRERLLRLEEVTARLQELAREGSPGGGFRDAWAIERGLQLGAEVVFDVGNHVLRPGGAALAGHGGGRMRTLSRGAAGGGRG